MRAHLVIEVELRPCCYLYYGCLACITWFVQFISVSGLPRGELQKWVPDVKLRAGVLYSGAV